MLYYMYNQNLGGQMNNAWLKKRAKELGLTETQLLAIIASK